ncbi:MAG: bacillithiol biosynthesis deacetylase BshB1 [Crocinitomicaceae bacterium]
MIEKLDILVFSAHPDDAELSCSGTIMKHIDAGLKVGIIDLTQGEMGSRGTIETRYAEAEASSNLLGVHARVNLKLADVFFEINKENKRLIVEQIRRFQPSVVLANAISDRHPDHARAGQLVSEACFLSGLRKFETMWDNDTQVATRPKAVYHYIQDYYIKPDFVVDISSYVDRKMEVIKTFKTQFFDPESKEPQTPISGEDFFDFITSRMIQFGRPIGANFAEGFTVERFPGVENLMNLK